MILSTPLIAPDTPLADRWQHLGEDIDALTRQIDATLAAHRDDCIRRYGFDWRRSDFTSGPPHPALASASEENDRG